MFDKCTATYSLLQIHIILDFFTNFILYILFLSCIHPFFSVWLVHIMSQNGGAFLIQANTQKRQKVGEECSANSVEHVEVSTISCSSWHNMFRHPFIFLTAISFVQVPQLINVLKLLKLLVLRLSKSFRMVIFQEVHCRQQLMLDTRPYNHQTTS